MAISLASALAIGAAAIGVAATATSTTLGVVGAVQQQRQAEANAKAQQAQLDYNAKLQEREAQRLEQETAENVRRQRQAAEELKAKQRALLGKSGAAMTSGSPLAVLGETAVNTEMETLDLHRSGYIESQQHRNQANILRTQSRNVGNAVPSRSGVALNIAGNVLSGVGQLAGQTLKIIG